MVDVDPPPLVAFPKSTTQLVFAKSELLDVFNIAFIKTDYISITSSIENQVGVTYNQQKIIRFRFK
jgi:hypothetical protein